ncbi:MAG: nitrogenase component 1 [Eubacteriales bacterium]
MEKVFEKTLQYTSPSHGDWGMVRMASLVPENYLLFVCPFACGRHGALGAIHKGFKDRLSYLYITHDDIVRGYDVKMVQAVSEVLKRLEKKPRAMLVIVSCLDELIGTDMTAIVKIIQKNHPEVDFGYSRMNPISLDSKSPPGVTIQGAMYGLLKADEKKKNQVNLLGVLESLQCECELFTVLENFGFDNIKQIGEMNTYDEFQTMAQSEYNIVISPAAGLAAKNMLKSHGTEFIMSFVSYDVDIVEKEYEKLAEYFGKELVNLEDVKEETLQLIEHAKTILGDTPIVISQGAVIKPFELAETLLKYGFHVHAVAAGEVIEMESHSCECVKDKIKFIHYTNPDIIKFENRLEEAVAIGFDAAYIIGSPHIVNVSGDMGMYGYYGIKKLMNMLVDAKQNKKDLRKLIEAYGVVI